MAGEGRQIVSGTGGREIAGLIAGWYQK